MQLLTPADAAGRVTAALKNAAEATGAGFDYLLRTATRESSLDATAQNPSSSARGLFQFIDSTWLETMKEEGPKLGLGAAAADISKTSSGRYVVADPARRAEILAMRDDPQTSALLAAAFTRRNAKTFESALGRAPTEGELYAAHFLGAQGAIQMTSLAATSPNASAAAAFPSQAAANRAIFYDKGQPRSAREVYDRLTAPPSGSAIAATTTTPAAARATRTALALQSTQDDAAYGPFNGGHENDGQTFHSLFKTGRRSPVASYVQQAWSSFGSAGLAADTSKTAAGAMSYAPASPAAASAATTPRAEAAVAAVSHAARARASKPKVVAAVAVQASETPAASLPVRSAATAETKAADAAVQAAPVSAIRRKMELTTFLGFGAQSVASRASASVRGRP